MEEIKTITPKEAEKIMKDGKPRGLFLIKENKKFFGIDNYNYSSMPWRKKFNKKIDCMRWLRGEDWGFDSLSPRMKNQIKKIEAKLKVMNLDEMYDEVSNEIDGAFKKYGMEKYLK